MSITNKKNQNPKGVKNKILELARRITGGDASAVRKVTQKKKKNKKA